MFPTVDIPRQLNFNMNVLTEHANTTNFQQANERDRQTNMILLSSNLMGSSLCQLFIV